MFRNPQFWNIYFFSILFPYYGNSLIPCFWNCMDFCFMWNISETLNFWMFVFSNNFSILWEFAFPMFWGFYGFTGKISPDPWVGKIWVFPYIFHKLIEILPHFFKNPQPANDMAFHRIFPCYRNFYIPKQLGLHEFSLTLNLWGRAEPGNYLCFPILVLWYGNSLIPQFGNCIRFLLQMKYVRNS